MELIFFIFLALMVFGPKRLPEVARIVARIMTDLRRAGNEFRYTLEEEVRALELKERKAAPPRPAPPPVPGAVAATAPPAVPGAGAPPPAPAEATASQSPAAPS